MPPQLKRLLPLFALFVGVFLLARYLLIPESFGEYGHYRGLSLDENAMLEATYSGKQACADCHEDMASLLSEDQHRGLSCEVCHGPGMGHVNAPDEVALKKPRERAHCGTCHAIHFAKRKEAILQVDLNAHYPEYTCVECHNPHQPWDLNLPDNPGGGL